jgi:orotate phosphoribosyltransferase
MSFAARRADTVFDALERGMGASDSASMSEAVATGRTRTLMGETRQDLIEVIRQRGHRRLDEPVQLASGDWSRHFIDAKRALARGSDLQRAAVALCDLATEMGVGFDAVGGLTMGADQFAHAIAMVTDCEWFSVRKTPKGRGTNQRVEGAVLGPGRAVLLVDDVVTRGGSIADALGAIRETGATVVAAVSLVDRGEFGRAVFNREGIPYRPLVTYADLGIPAVGSESGITAATH